MARPIALRRSQKYPWAYMEPGDRFFAPIRRHSMRAQLAQARRTHGLDFIARAVPGGVRVWLNRPIPIDRGILMPQPQSAPHKPKPRPVRYPFYQMRMGDRVSLYGRVKGIKQAARRAGASRGFRFATTHRFDRKGSRRKRDSTGTVWVERIA